jgi:hypothetical protein
MKLDAFGHYKPGGAPRWYLQPSESFSRTCPFSPVARNEDQLAAELFPHAAHHDGASGALKRLTWLCG